MLDITVSVDDRGRITSPTDRRRLREQLLFRFAGRECRIRVSEPKRSASQNAFYWGIIIGTIHEAMLRTGAAQHVDTETGEITTVTPEDIHHDLKSTYLPPRIVELFGETRRVPPTTTALTKAEFSDYCERVMTDERVRRLLAYAGMEFPLEQEADVSSAEVV